MATQVSPGIKISEVDKTLALGQVALTEGGIAGFFKWGPTEEIRTVVSEEDLVNTFWKPDTNSASFFFTAANFLAYSNTLRVVRVVDADHAAAATAAYSNVAVNATATFTVNDSSTTMTCASGNALALLYAGQTVYLANATVNATVTVASVANDTTVYLSSVPTNNVTAGSAYLYGAYIPNSDVYDSTWSAGTTVLGPWAAKYVGALGNSLRVDVCASANAYKITSNSTTANVTTSANVVVLTTGADYSSWIVADDVITVGSQSRKVLSVNTSALVINAAFTTNLTSSGFTRSWKYASLFTGAPGTSDWTSARAGANDEMHVVVVDQNGVFTGVANTVLEKYEFVSKASDAKTADGAANYYKEAINRKSPYVRWLSHDAAGTNWGSPATGVTFVSPALSKSYTLKGGVDGGEITDGDLQRGYDMFKDERVEVSFVLGANASASLATYIIGNIVEPKMFSMGFFSPTQNTVVNNVGSEAVDVIAFRNSLPSTSYAVLDSGWKYQYDKYNDVYRYVPLNGDTAGCAVRTDQVAESWFSPAGFTRGQIKNVVKLPFNPNQAERDDLYRSGVNSIVTFPGQGTVLFGDKTLQGKPSAFDRINVRRLFIALEKTIERSAKQQLFEQNDSYSRQAFVSMVEPYLRSVRGRRGISDYYVVCDETNNPPAVVDANEFRADIYVKPIRSINFIALNFVAVRSDVAFTEVITNLA